MSSTREREQTFTKKPGTVTSDEQRAGQQESKGESRLRQASRRPTGTCDNPASVPPRCVRK